MRSEYTAGDAPFDPDKETDVPEPEAAVHDHRWLATHRHADLNRGRMSWAINRLSVTRVVRQSSQSVQTVYPPNHPRNPLSPLNILLRNFSGVPYGDPPR